MAWRGVPLIWCWRGVSRPASGGATTVGPPRGGGRGIAPVGGRGGGYVGPGGGGGGGVGPGGGPGGRGRAVDTPRRGEGRGEGGGVDPGGGGGGCECSVGGGGGGEAGLVCGGGGGEGDLALSFGLLRLDVRPEKINSFKTNQGLFSWIIAGGPAYYVLHSQKVITICLFLTYQAF